MNGKILFFNFLYLLEFFFKSLSHINAKMWHNIPILGSLNVNISKVSIIKQHTQTYSSYKYLVKQKLTKCAYGTMLPLLIFSWKLTTANEN